MPKTQSPVGTAASFSRRHFLKSTSLVAGATALSGPYLLRGQNLNSKLNVGVIGAGGKGSSDTDDLANLGENIYALSDVDTKTLDARTAAAAAPSGDNTARRQRDRTYPQAKKFQDYRKMLEKVGDRIDIVTVSTPDHHHAVAASMAMKMGKHVYVQKPLVQTVQEARYLRQLAKDMKLATQMGNQGSAGSGLRRAVEVIQAGVIGKPQELHVWSNRPIWPQGIEAPVGAQAVPANVDWDVWIGPAAMRPYNSGYHPFAWRGYKDFGTGALGDMACHTVNMPFRALKLGYPTVVECEEASQMHVDTYPKTSRIRFEFPEREGLPPLKFWWYDGSPQDKSVKILRPTGDLTKEIVAMRDGLPASGCLIVGDKGKVFSPDDYGSQFFVLCDKETEFTAAAKHEACKAVPQTIPRNEGPGGDDQRQKAEWLRMVRGGAPAYSNFDIAAYLTEIILLGCVAMRVGVGKKLDWDGPHMEATNAPEAAQFVKREYRPGWALT